MFSRYKKGAGAPAKPVKTKQAEVEEPKTVPIEDAQKTSLRKPTQSPSAQVAGVEKERKRKERLAEIKIDLHRALLDNLNLGALEGATESDLREEIGAIAGEALQERNIVLNREDRTTLTQELYDEGARAWPA